MAEREQPIIDPIEAYPLSQRAAYAEQCILWASAGGWLSVTSCTHIVRTYGCLHIVNDLKAFKKSQFPEFARGEE